MRSVPPPAPEQLTPPWAVLARLGLSSLALHAGLTVVCILVGPPSRSYLASVWAAGSLAFLVSLGLAWRAMHLAGPLYRVAVRSRGPEGDPMPPSRAALRDAFLAPGRLVPTAVAVHAGGLVFAVLVSEGPLAMKASEMLTVLGAMAVVLAAGVLLWRHALGLWITAFPSREVEPPEPVRARRELLMVVGAPAVGALLAGAGAMVGASSSTESATPPVLLGAVFLLALVGFLALRALARLGARLDQELSSLSQRVRDLGRRLEAKDEIPEGLERGLSLSSSNAIARAATELATGYTRDADEEEHRRHTLAELQRSKTLFMASMSHDLRSPLNSILGFSELLLEGHNGELNGQQAESVRMIQRSGAELLELLNDILDSARFDAGRMPLRREWTPSVEILTEAVRQGNELVELRGVGGAARVHIEAELQPGLPPVYVDRDRVVQAVVCLFRHAFRAMNRGTIRLFARVTGAREGAAGQLRVDVVDEGGGIQSDDRERMFEAFYALTSTTGRRIGGLGLSLALARSLVRAHGGEIWFESREGEGTTFAVAIPVDARRSEAA